MTRQSIEKVARDFVQKSVDNGRVVDAQLKVDTVHYLYGYISNRIDFHTIVDAIDFICYQLTVEKEVRAEMDRQDKDIKGEKVGK